MTQSQLLVSSLVEIHNFHTHMQKSTIITISLIVLVIAGILFFSSSDNKQAAVPSSEMDTFAQCISDSEAILYGAWWCPHCEEQREMFGVSEQFLPYQECSLPNSKNQNLICKKAEIQVYPTWIFRDGTKVEGSLSFDEISKHTNCPLPSELAGDATEKVVITPENEEGATTTDDVDEGTEKASSTEETAE